MRFETPIFIAAFNRPDCLRNVLERLAPLRPRRVFFALDGPRQQVTSDALKCKEVRALVDDFTKSVEKSTVDAAPTNMGCGKRVSTGLELFFQLHKEGIILEDDTLPSKSFFHFCEHALRVYRDNPRIGHICGSRFEWADEPENTPQLTIHPHIWGWATWAETWKHYDYRMTAYTNWRVRSRARNFVQDSVIWRHWLDSFDRVRFGRVDTWDYQWTFALWQERRLAVVPPVNLIENIGFGPNATHTISPTGAWRRGAKETGGPIAWNKLKERNRISDSNVQQMRYGTISHSPLRRLVRILWWSCGSRLFRRERQ